MNQGTDLDVQRAVSMGTCASYTAGRRVTSALHCGSYARMSSTNRQETVLPVWWWMWWHLHKWLQQELPGD